MYFDTEYIIRNKKLNKTRVLFYKLIPNFFQCNECTMKKVAKIHTI